MPLRAKGTKKVAVSQVLCRLSGKTPSFTTTLSVVEGIQSHSFDPCEHYQSDPFAQSSTKKDASETELKKTRHRHSTSIIVGLIFFLLPSLLGLAS